MTRFAFVAQALSLALSLLADLAPGQEKGGTQPDPLKTFEPRSKPGTGQKFLENFVGDWDVVKTFHPRAGDPVRATGTCKQAMIQDGRFLQSDFTFKADTGKTTGLGLIGFEPETGLFTSIWVDSRQTRMSARQSEQAFKGDEIVLFSKELGGKDGRRSKTVTRLEEEGKKIVHRQYGISADGTERLVMELVLTKAPARKE